MIARAPKPEQEAERLTVGDAAAILGLSVDMVRVLHRKGQLAAFRTPHGYRLFTRAEVERLALERKRRV